MIRRTAAAAVLATVLACATPDPAADRLAVVARVVDGDTVVLRGLDTAPVRVRVIGLDTPEAGDCWGPEATGHAWAVLPPGSEVRVRAGPEARDRYGRWLLHLWTPAGRPYAEDAVRAGHARAHLVRPDPGFARRMRAAESAARRGHRGLWSACRSPPLR